MTTTTNWSLKQINIICILLVICFTFRNMLFAQSKTDFIQPIIGYYPFSVTNNANSANPFFFSVNLGLKLASFKNAN